MYLHNIKLSFALLMLIISLSACDEINESPAEISFNLKFDAETTNNLSVSEGNFTITEIKLEAIKENGERIILSENFDNEEFRFTNGELKNLFKFNLPPAIYDLIDIEMEINSAGNGNSMAVKGILNSPMPQIPSFPLVFEHKAREIIKLSLTKSVNSANEIVIQKNDNKEITIVINAGSWFETVNPGLLTAAENVPINGANTILINNNYNPDLYTLISSRIQQSFSVSL